MTLDSWKMGWTFFFFIISGYFTVWMIDDSLKWGKESAMKIILVSCSFTLYHQKFALYYTYTMQKNPKRIGNTGKRVKKRKTEKRGIGRERKAIWPLSKSTLGLLRIRRWLCWLCCTSLRVVRVSCVRITARHQNISHLFACVCVWGFS